MKHLNTLDIAGAKKGVEKLFNQNPDLKRKDLAASLKEHPDPIAKALGAAIDAQKTEKEGFFTRTWHRVVANPSLDSRVTTVHEAFVQVMLQRLDEAARETLHGEYEKSAEELADKIGRAHNERAMLEQTEKEATISAERAAAKKPSLSTKDEFKQLFDEFLKREKE